MTNTNYIFDWSDLAFGSKKPLSSLQATFVAAPRQMSARRLTQLAKAYLPQGNIVIGVAKELFVDGFEGQDHFRTLQLADVEPLAAKVAASASPHKVYILSYFQRELDYILQKVTFEKQVLVNGSWRYAFHNLPAFYTLAKQRRPIEFVSPFTDEAEAKAYGAAHRREVELPTAGHVCDEQHLMRAVKDISTLSYDYCLQVGAVLATKNDETYRFLKAAYNHVVPYETYALHHGSLREKHFSPPHDINHHDTIHAEVMLLIEAQREGLSLEDASLFINLLPCPACARTLSQTDIAEVVYTQDHSAGYAVALLEASGKKVRRLLAEPV